MTRRILFTSMALAAMASAAQAHVGVGGTSGFINGFTHPLGGLDHVLAMVAVGLFAAQLGGRARWLVPASFATMMAVGGAAGMAGVDLPFVEAGIGLSVLALGAIVALRWNAPVPAAMSIAGFFAVFHGHAHGAEMPAGAAGLTYALGFVLATATLHGAGLALGLTAQNSRRLTQIGGGALALAGAVLLTGAI